MFKYQQMSEIGRETSDSVIKCYDHKIVFEVS